MPAPNSKKILMRFLMNGIFLIGCMTIMFISGCASSEKKPTKEMLSLMNQGDAFSASRQHDQAIASYTKAIEMNPEYAEAYYYRGNIYKKTRQYDRAIEDFSTALGLNPEYADAYNQRGNVYIRKSLYDQAIEDFNAAIKLNPMFAEAYSGRGFAYLKKKQRGKACSDLKRAAEMGYDKVYHHMQRLNLCQ